MGWLLRDESRKMHFRKKLNYDFGGIKTPDLCCSSINDTPLRALLSQP